MDDDLEVSLLEVSLPDELEVSLPDDDEVDVDLEVCSVAVEGGNEGELG